MEDKHWTEAAFVGFDTETTGVNTSTDRILQAAVVGHGYELTVIVNPGVPIPAAASAVHGITDDKLSKIAVTSNGIHIIARILEAEAKEGHPIVIYNAPYDLKLLAMELQRHHLADLQVSSMRFLDPLIIDRAIDKFRKGSRTLESVCAHYEVPLNGAHDAVSDARAAVALMRKLSTVPAICGRSLADLQLIQAQWHKEWSDGINKYWAKTGKNIRSDGLWPM